MSEPDMKVMNVWAPLCVHLHTEKHQAALSGSGFQIKKLCAHTHTHTMQPMGEEIHIL